MNRQEKESSIASLKEHFSKSKATLVVSYKGLSVTQMQKLRRAVRGQGGSLQVAKTTLMERAVQNMECAQALSPYFKDQVALIFIDNEIPAVAKAVNDFAKENQALALVAGCMDSALVTKDMVVRIASLPSREVLLAQVCGTLKAPITQLACVIEALKEKLSGTAA